MTDIKIVSKASGLTAYRVVPDPDDPVILQLDGKLTRVLDVSASCFFSPLDSVQSGRRYAFSLDLPTGGHPIRGYVDALPEPVDGLLHCRFVDLSNEDLDALHHYVLVRQKEVIRTMRAGKLG